MIGIPLVSSQEMRTVSVLPSGSTSYCTIIMPAVGKRTHIVFIVFASSFRIFDDDQTSLLSKNNYKSSWLVSKMAN